MKLTLIKRVMKRKKKGICVSFFFYQIQGKRMESVFSFAFSYQIPQMKLFFFICLSFLVGGLYLFWIYTHLYLWVIVIEICIYEVIILGRDY
jgi:hypothetical protein